MKARGVLTFIISVAGALCGFDAKASDQVTVGYITTLTGPGGLMGEEMVNSFKLAVDHLGGRLGGLPVNLVVLDDQQKPQVAIQNARRLIEKDHADVISGMLFSNVTEAVLNTVLPAGQLVIHSGGVASQRAGKDCHPNSISTFWNTDTVYREIGSYLKRQGAKKPYLMAMTIQPGKDAMTGFKLGYGDNVGGETYVRFDQSDFASELTDIKRANPDAVVYFIPGGNGIAFLKQYAQSGLVKDYPLYAFTIQADELTFPAVGDAALGMLTVGNWSPALDNPANKRFVTDFRTRHGRTPTTLGAMAYDNALLLDSAIRLTNGDVTDKDKLRDAALKAEFQSVRGAVTFGSNNVPRQNFYLSKVAKTETGVLHNELLQKVATNAEDPYAHDCKMKR